MTEKDYKIVPSFSDYNSCARCDFHEVKGNSTCSIPFECKASSEQVYQAIEKRKKDV